MAAVGKANAECACALLAFLSVIVLMFSPAAAARPVPSGWDVKLSTGSSDSTLWRSFNTHAQAAGYHRLLLDLETGRKSREVLETVDVQATSSDFSTMDYADPRSNKPGSSDETTPPAP